MGALQLPCACVTFRSQVPACWDAEVDDRVKELREYNKRVKIYCCIVISIFVILALSFALLVLHALVKTVMVSFYCDCGWNLRLNETVSRLRFTSLHHITQPPKEGPMSFGRGE